MSLIIAHSTGLNKVTLLFDSTADGACITVYVSVARGCMATVGWTTRTSNVFRSEKRVGQVNDKISLRLFHWHLNMFISRGTESVQTVTCG